MLKYLNSIGYLNKDKNNLLFVYLKSSLSQILLFNKWNFYLHFCFIKWKFMSYFSKCFWYFYDEYITILIKVIIGKYNN